jgi:AraC-like DNA-binding protein
MHYLISIGVILAIIGGVLIISLKDPLKTSDKLLLAILGAFVIKFLLDEVSLITANQFVGGLAAVFGISSIVTCGWYIKYITDTTSKFGAKELAMYLPLAVLLLFIIVIMVVGQSVQQQLFYYNVLLLIMIAIIVFYFSFCINMIGKHQRLIRQYYSGQSGNITVNWIIVIIAIQILEFILKGVLAHFSGQNETPNTQIITNEFCYIIETFLLVVLGIWQKSIPVYIAANDDAATGAIPADDVKRYQQKLEKFMNDHRPYLDPELTIEKLSELTKIRKIMLSQTLNKGFNKNFFTFIKEYRIRHVEQILKSKTHEHATIMDIAYESGFNSKTGFNRAFKEVTGKTPTEYIETLIFTN